MKWLITGGCGFIGTGLIRFLLAEGGHGIRVFDNLSTGTRDDLGQVAPFTEGSGAEAPFPEAGEVELIVGDILDEAALSQAADKADVVVHLAANTGVGPSVEDPRHDCLTNVLGTFNALEAARHNGVGRFVFASSGAPAGEVEPPIHEELPPHPVAPYGASKLAGEGYCSAYFRSFGVETVALRFGNVYGPGSIHKGSVVAKFIKEALSGERLEIYGDGSQTRDFIFIDDLVRAIRLAAAQPHVGGETFQIATSQETTVGEIAALLVSLLAAHGVRDVEVFNGEKRVGDVMRNYSDTRKAREWLGWQPEYGLEQGLDRTVHYFLS
ncbi:NAD-dependent epimerase/dehydratase family protein [Halospina sp. K52047b]|uniref:NAD-dependent epimerase/dehydratase family protein n=1 Tax=Halospina sp. K52047b TaxID=2614160 RepID=UPI00124ACB07|nr:NAD-dependent epimerase/dehydratase family protein [Halospina sp. K52047b]KAA8981910.1 NAD-dependent epimerase/dehydratase family protein [Halospina sp. K52047b]